MKVHIASSKLQKSHQEKKAKENKEWQEIMSNTLQFTKSDTSHIKFSLIIFVFKMLESSSLSFL